MTDALAIPPCPRPCVECPEAEHHWFDQATDDDGNETEPHFACKHCDATCSMCVECLQPFIAVDDSGMCSLCQFAEDSN